MATQERLMIEQLLMITNKQKQDVPFVLNKAQADVDAALTGRDIIPKSRQRGISAYFLARNLIKCLSVPNTAAVIISHDVKSTQRMLKRVRFFVENLRCPKPVIKDDNKNELSFPKMNSTYYIGTAGQRKFGRGDMITDLHCSEIAYWPDPKELIAGLFQAVPRSGGEISIESTGNGVGNWYHRACMRAYENKGGFRLHFISWLDDPDCIVPVSAEEAKEIMGHLDHELDEPEDVERFGLTAGQVLFRREKIFDEFDGDVNLFRQEYPATLDQCFMAKGNSLFAKVNYKPIEEWRESPEDHNLHCLLDRHSNPRSKYVIGADVAGGVGEDNSVAQVLDLANMEQVAEWVSGKYDPEQFAYILRDLGYHYGKAYISVESNNHGAATLLKLREIYPRNLIYSNRSDSDNLIKLGYRTTKKTKPIMIARLRTDLLRDITIHSDALKGELDNFVEKENGDLGAEEGCHDDRVMALAVANMARNVATMLLNPHPDVVQAQEDVDPFSLEGMIYSIRKQHANTSGDYPIPRQDIDSDEYSNLH